jgi:hypothetical protein
MCFYLQSNVQTFYGLKLVKVTCNKKLCSSLVRNVRVLFFVPRVIGAISRDENNALGRKKTPLGTKKRAHFTRGIEITMNAAFLALFASSRSI